MSPPNAPLPNAPLPSWMQSAQQPARPSCYVLGKPNPLRATLPQPGANAPSPYLLGRPMPKLGEDSDSPASMDPTQSPKSAASSQRGCAA
jgi:hypothetical protein